MKVSSNDTLVKTRGLTKQFEEQVSVDHLNLEIKRGQIFGFLGPNGAGKTTTIRMLLGLMKPTDGEVEIFGQKFSNNRLEILKKVGALVEAPSYYRNLTGYENLKLSSKILNVPEERITEVLGIVGLTQAANKKVKQYSLGMKQRLGIALALLGSPELLILDEPTNGLDPNGIHEIRQLIKRMPTEFGITVIISSHNLAEIEMVATHVGIIQSGRLKFQGTLEKIREDNKPILELKVDQPAKAQEILKSFNVLPELKAEKILIKDFENKPSTINKLLVDNEISVEHLVLKMRTLEDIFLDITGRMEAL
jgi:lantibiotic transport system ATP-binding protein